MFYSELHVFRGIEPAGAGFIMGHEFVGEIVELGSAVKNLQKGDRVVTAFTTSWSVVCPLEARGSFA
jgi:threonine dehydrogenase-like Zn-dependent dehydrogenase